MKLFHLLENQSGIVYHGTTVEIWKKIQKLGKMEPQTAPNSFYRGNSSELPWTKAQLYFAKDIGMAKGYASDQEEHLGSPAIILAVPASFFDIKKCYPDDDDFIVRLANTYETDEDEAKEFIEKNSQRVITDLEKIVKEWRKKFNFNTEFGYRGSIELKHITVSS